MNSIKAYATINTSAAKDSYHQATLTSAMESDLLPRRTCESITCMSMNKQDSHCKLGRVLNK